MPYSGNIFELRHKYEKVFYQDQFKIVDYEKDEGAALKVHKIQYQVNLLPSMSKHFSEEEIGKRIEDKVIQNEP